jgi:hypothetical protein
VPTLHDFLVFLHVLSTAVWLAAALWVAGDVRRTLDLGRPHVDALAARVRPALGLDAAGGIATIVTGALLLWAEGMGHPRLGISIGILLTLARLVVLAVARRSWRSILARLQAGETVPPRDPAARRLGMLTGIAHTLWLLALAGMIF